MKKINSAIESISLAVIHVLNRSKELKGKDQYAIINEFAEWIVDIPDHKDVTSFPDMTMEDYEQYPIE